MIKAQDLMIGDWVSVGGKPVEVRMISRKKIGYHRDGDKTRLVYVRLADVEPLVVKEVDFGINEWIVNGVVRIKVNSRIVNFNLFEDEEARVSNIFGECLVMNTTYVHKLQHIFKIISRL